MFGWMQLATLQAKVAEDNEIISELQRKNVELAKAAETAQNAKRCPSDCNNTLADTNLVRARLVLVDVCEVWKLLCKPGRVAGKSRNLGHLKTWLVVRRGNIREYIGRYGVL
jgi:hypothetical protein